MNVLEIQDKQLIDSFIKSQQWSQFLQSADWAEFQQSLGHQTWFLAVQDDDKIIAIDLIIKNNLPLGKSYLYCPRGPIIVADPLTIKYKQVFNLLLDKIKEIAQQEKAIFLKLEPPTDLLAVQDFLKMLDCKKAKASQPPDTLLLDLRLSSEELLQQMHPKTRYNLKLAQQKITVRTSREPVDLEKFWQLTQVTGQRQGFSHFVKNYYEKLLAADLSVKLYLAEYQNKIIAANLILFFGDIAAYLHGASDYQFRQLMAPYLLQWQAIIDAQQAGYHYYDFWGVAPAGAGAKHPWSGVTRFKLGFVNNNQTKITNLVGTWDLPYKIFWYKLYRLGKRLKG